MTTILGNQLAVIGGALALAWIVGSFLFRKLSSPSIRTISRFAQSRAKRFSQSKFVSRFSQVVSRFSQAKFISQQRLKIRAVRLRTRSKVYKALLPRRKTLIRYVLLLTGLLFLYKIVIANDWRFLETLDYRNFFIAIMLVILFIGLISLLWSFYRIRERAIWSKLDLLKGLMPTVTFLLLLGLLTYLIVFVAFTVSSELTIQWSLIAIFVSLIVAFGFSWLIPTAWRSFELLCWKLSLGNSITAIVVRDYALRDFQLSIIEEQTDRALQDPAASLFSISRRLLNFPYLFCDLKRMKEEMDQIAYDRNIQEMNEGWLIRWPPELLRDYMTAIMESSEKEKKERKLRGRCAVASIAYLLGYLEQASKIAEENWQLAEELEQSKGGSEFKWRASHAYFNTKAVGLGRFEEATREMMVYWYNYYTKLPKSERTRISKKDYGLVVNPVLAVPRILIYAAAFNGGPPRENFSSPLSSVEDVMERHQRYWPSVAKDENWSLDKKSHDLLQLDVRSELDWVGAWYREAQVISQSAADIVSLAITHAFAGLYYLLWYLDDKDGLNAQELADNARDAFDRIDRLRDPLSQDDSNIPLLRYLKEGYEGVLKLVTTRQRPQEALVRFRRAARFSDITGTRFAEVDMIFMCCRALAAQMSEPHQRLEANRYIDEAKTAAEKIGIQFYFDLYYAAYAAIQRIRGNETFADRIEAGLGLGRDERQIRAIRIFIPSFRR